MSLCTNAGKSMVCGVFEPGAGISNPVKLKLHAPLDGFKSPVPAKVIETAHVPFPLGRIVTRGPRESSSVYSEIVQTAGVDVVKVMLFAQIELLPSVELMFANRNAPETGTAFGAITLTRVACRKNVIVCETGVAARKRSLPA